MRRRSEAASLCPACMQWLIQARGKEGYELYHRPELSNCTLLSWVGGGGGGEGYVCKTLTSTPFPFPFPPYLPADGESPTALEAAEPISVSTAEQVKQEVLDPNTG